MLSLATACLFLVFAESIISFSIARAFQGIASAASWVAAQPLAAQQIDTSKKKGLDRSITIAYGLGMILGPALGSIGGLRTPFYINFILAALVGVVALFTLKKAALTESVRDHNYLVIIKRPGIIVACLTIMFLYASLGMMEVLFPLYMDSLASAKGSIGVLFLILHTNNAAKTVDRLISVFPANEQEGVRNVIGETLRAVVAQQLMPKLGGGRVAAIEILFSSHAIGNMIREGKTSQITSAIQTGIKEGMIVMDGSIKRLLEEKRIIARAAYDKAIDKSLFKDAVEDPSRAGKR